MASNHGRLPNNLTFHTHITVNLPTTTAVLRIVHNLNIKQTANNLRSAIRSAVDSGILQRIADAYKERGALMLTAT